jgi:hypothetical protein
MLMFFEATQNFYIFYISVTLKKHSKSEKQYIEFKTCHDVFYYYYFQQRSVTGQMTETDARRFCENYMDQSPGFRKCKNVPNVNPSDSIETCVLDIQVS